jgi:hypothetical protein
MGLIVFVYLFFLKLFIFLMERLKRNHYIKIGGDWYNLCDLYDSVVLKGVIINPVTKKKFTKKEIESIKHNFNNKFYIENEPNDTNDTIDTNDTNDINTSLSNKLDDYIEIFESQITELYSKQEDLYSLIHNQQTIIDKLDK